MKKINFWYLSSFLISFVVIIPIITVGISFFEETSNYYEILNSASIIFNKSQTVIESKNSDANAA